MAFTRFGSLPNWWFRDESLFSHLKSNQTGEGIAAMKCMLALSVLIDFYTKDVSTSITELEMITGLSRPMVIKGTNKLEQMGLVQIDKSNYKNNYQLLTTADKNWAKVPSDIIKKQLKQISNRGMAPFVALKIYITLISLRYQDKRDVKVSHETIREYTKVQTNQIRAGLDVLFSCSMIHIVQKEERTSNEYRLIG